MEYDIFNKSEKHQNGREENFEPKWMRIAWKIQVIHFEMKMHVFSAYWRNSAHSTLDWKMRFASNSEFVVPSNVKSSWLSFRWILQIQWASSLHMLHSLHFTMKYKWSCWIVNCFLIDRWKVDRIYRRARASKLRTHRYCSNCHFINETKWWLMMPISKSVRFVIIFDKLKSFRWLPSNFRIQKLKS